MKNLTKAQRQALEDVRDHGDAWHRLPKYGSGRGNVSGMVAELIKGGLATRSKAGRWRITELGRKALEG